MPCATHSSVCNCAQTRQNARAMKWQRALAEPTALLRENGSNDHEGSHHFASLRCSMPSATRPRPNSVPSVVG